MRINLGRIGLVLGIVLAVAGLLGGWMLLPHRMEAAEKKIEAIETKLESQRDLLLRIDENVKSLKERVK